MDVWDHPVCIHGDKSDIFFLLLCANCFMRVFLRNLLFMHVAAGGQTVKDVETNLRMATLCFFGSECHESVTARGHTTWIMR